jgi:ATP-dependent protease ClpP protease subunit
MIEGHLYTEGVVKEDYLETMRAQIAALPVEAEIIIHHIKSPGGSVYAAWKTIPELMKIGKPIKSMIEGEASSIASWIAVGPAFEVEATDPSTAMIHEPSFPDGIIGSIGVDELEVKRVELEQIRQSMAEAYAKKSGRPISEWLTLMKKNTRLNASMLKEYGLVDKITPTEPRRVAALMQELEAFTNQLKESMNIFKKAAPAMVAAVDLKTKDGKMVNVQSDNGDLVGKPVTVEGQPAEGSFPLEDGRVLVCQAGKVVSVGTPVPEETAEQKLQKQIADMQGQLQAIKSAEQAKTTAEAEAKKAEEAAKAAEEAK